MSFVATNWAWDQVLPPAPKLILMALADNADDCGFCWPRVKSVAKRCTVSERTVQRTLRTFEASGLIRVIRRFRPEDGRQTSNGYHLSLQAYPDKMSPPRSQRHQSGDAGDAEGVSQLRRGEGVSAVAPLEPSPQPSSSPPQQPNAGSDGLVLPLTLDPNQLSAMAGLLSSCGRELGQAIADEVEGIATSGKLRSCPLALAKSLLAKAETGAFSPRLGLEVAAKRVAARKRHIEATSKAQLKAIDLAEELDPLRKKRRDAARAKAVEELKKRGIG